MAAATAACAIAASEAAERSLSLPQALAECGFTWARENAGKLAQDVQGTAPLLAATRLVQAIRLRTAHGLPEEIVEKCEYAELVLTLPRRFVRQ